MDEERIARLRISLEDWEPEIWRTVEVPLSLRLDGLHDVIQAAMGWDDDHLWEFEAGKTRYGLEEPLFDGTAFTRADEVTLADLVNRRLRFFDYRYDMGDDWRHRIAIEAVTRAETGVAYPRLIGGARSCPPEDVGGTPGFAYLLAALADPAHEQHEECLEIHGPFDAEAFDAEAATRRVAALRPRAG
jgi:hypothetical protein